MRLNPFNPDNINVSRGGGGGLSGGGGKLGCGAIVIALIGALVFGIDPGQMLGTMEGMQQQGAPTEQAGGQSAEEICGVNQYSMESCNALASLDETWAPLFQRAGIAFRQPRLHFIEGGGVNTSCGAASSAQGPFYCPGDQTIYIDTAFYDQLDRQLGAGPGDFARYYVIAHEYGHHVQTITGVADQIRSAQQQNPGAANQLQVLMELQADCYAGVWAYHANQQFSILQNGDVEGAIKAASGVGDDTLQKESRGYVVPDSFTHGSSAQRVRWFQRGLDGGRIEACDTFSARNL